MAVKRVEFEWMRKPTPIPCARVIKVFVDPKNVGRGLNLKEIILYNTSSKILPEPRRVLAFKMTLDRLVSEGLLKFAPSLDRYYMDTQIDVAAVRAHIRSQEESKRKTHNESLAEDLEGVGLG